MNVTLINKTRRMRVINLPHEVYCASLGRCACSELNGKRVASSLTLPAGAVVPGIDEAVLVVPGMGRAVAAGELSYRREPPASQPPPQPGPRKASRRSGRKKAR